MCVLSSCLCSALSLIPVRGWRFISIRLMMMMMMMMMMMIFTTRLSFAYINILRQVCQDVMKTVA